MKNVLTKEMIALRSINEKATKDINQLIQTIFKTKIEESVTRPSKAMITNTLMPAYFDRTGVVLKSEVANKIFSDCSRDKVQLMIDVLKEKYSTINQRKELINQIEGIRKLNTSTYLKIKMELYPRIHQRACIDEFFKKCTAIYQMQPINQEQIRQIKSIALIPEVYEGLYSRGIKLNEHIDPANGKILQSFDRELINKMNNEDASSFIQFFYTYKQQYAGITLSPLQRNTLRNLYTQLGETDKASPIHLMYITTRNYDKVVNELNERIRRNSYAQENAWENREFTYVANEWTYENMRESNREVVETKRIIKFVHIVWSALGEYYQEDETLQALLPYVSIGDRMCSHIKEDTEGNKDKLVRLIRQKVRQAMKSGAITRDDILKQHDDIIEMIYPSEI